MSNVTELRKDADELRQFITKATRQKVIDILTIECRKIETEIITKGAEQMNIEATKSEGPTSGAAPVSKTKPVRHRLPTDIRTYAWDQSDKFVKIYATVKGVNKAPKENVACDFKQKSLHLYCTDIGDQDFQLSIPNLAEEILPADSYCKIKTDTVLLMLKKKSAGQKWTHFTQTEKKLKEREEKDKAPKLDTSKDPQDSLMGLMKQMYDDGDDEMKRTLAKAWSESRDKQGAGDPGIM